MIHTWPYAAAAINAIVAAQPTASTPASADTAGVSLTETRSLVVRLQRTDTVSFGFADLITDSFLQPYHTDELLPGLTDQVRTPIALTSRRADAVSISLSDLRRVINVTLRRADAPTVSVADLRSILARLGRTDAVQISLTEARAILARLLRTDAVTASAAEARQQAATISRLDTVGPRITDGNVRLASALNRTDVATVGITEARTIAAMLHRADSVGPRIVETAAGAFKEITSSDILGVHVLQFVTERLVILNRADALTVAAQDARRGAVVTTLSRADQAAVGYADIHALAITLRRSDEITLESVLDTYRLTRNLFTTDLISLPLPMTVRDFDVKLTRGDAASVGIDGAARIHNAFATSDVVAVSLEEAATMLQALFAQDGLALSIESAIEMLIAMRRSDQLRVKLLEDGNTASTGPVYQTVEVKGRTRNRIRFKGVR